MSKVLPLALALVGAGAPVLAAQQVPTVSVGRALVTFEEPFTNISGVRELPGGRVLVADPRDKVVQLVDFTAQTATRVGREGSGPGEYQFPRSLIPLPGNETLLADPMQDRFLRIDATGKIVETITSPDGMGPGASVGGADAQGRVYWEGSAFGGGGRGGITIGGGDGGPPQARDSVPIMRWDRRTNRVDTLIQIKGPEMKIATGGSQTNRTVMIRSQPFTPRDAWGVAPDGRVSVVRSAPYRVDQRAAAGARTSGAAVPVAPLRLTQRDKDDFVRNLRNAPRITRSVGAGSGGATPPTPPPPSADDYEWPETKPYFDAQSVRMSPAGELWVMRYRAAGDEVPVYDVFNAAGNLVRRVSFPVKTRLVGFGQDAIYAVRTDEDDLQYLERYRDCGANCDTRAVPVR